MEIKRQYRPEIEGIRVIAALLVAVYHIWMSQVSGGVDVFFVVSGFLITTSLLSKYARDGYIKFGSFVFGLLKRLLPHAFVVLIFITIASYFILPEVRYFETIREIVASIFYFENWQLAITGTDYLDQHNEQSPVQHFWAMSIQGQFYIIWFIIISLSIWIFNKTKFNLKNIFITVLAVLFVMSFIYSVYLTGVNQPWAYFDTRTRVWEFAIGGLLMVFIFKIKLPMIISFFVGWLGLIILSTTGIIFDVGQSFPGYVALVPVLAAVLMLIAGQNPSTYGVEKALGSRPMVWLGGLSYGIYLWHWPLLIFYYEIFETTEVNLVNGLVIILLSILLSYLTSITIEKPINNSFKQNKNILKSFKPIIGMFIVLISLVGTWYFYSENQSSIDMDLIGSEDYPGAFVSFEEYSNPPAVEPIPSLSGISNDRAKPYGDGCHVSPGDSEVTVCEYGDTENYNHTVALVGGSKSTHWLPSLETFAQEENIKILNMTKSGCRFTTSANVVEDCYEWNEDIVQTIVEENVDLVVTLVDVNTQEDEVIPEGFLEQFEKLNNNNIPVLGLRDTPHFDKNIPECLNDNEMNIEECGAEKAQMYDEPSGWERLENPPNNVHYRDYTNFICPDGFCAPIVGNVIVYIDHNHLSVTFTETMGPIIRGDVLDILAEETGRSEESTESEADDTANREKESNDGGLMDLNNTENGWLNFDGEVGGNTEYRITPRIEYNPDKVYDLNIGAYITYYNGDEFIQTVQQAEGAIEQVEEADNIRVSYHYTFEDKISLNEK